MQKSVKILHTADWHLGKKLSSFNRLEEQKAVMDEIVNYAEQEKVDLVLVAGDVFDTFNPPVEAVDLLYKTLKLLANNGKRPVVVIGGNHDNADRLDAPNPLAKECGIIFLGSPLSIAPIMEIPNGFSITKSAEQFLEIQLPNLNFPIRIIATAFANEQRLKAYFDPENKIKSLNEILQQKWQALADEFCDDKGVNILTTHLYMSKQGGEEFEECEGEKPLNIGNADKVYSKAIPPQIQYTALGHLHQMHNVGTKEQPVVYSGSPVAYSFSEANQNKFVILLEAQPAQKVAYQKLKLTGGRKLERKTFVNVEDAELWLQQNPTCLVELTIVTDDFISHADKEVLYAAHDGIIHLIPLLNAQNNQLSNSGEPVIARQMSLEDLFQRFVKEKNGIEPSEGLMSVFFEILNHKN